MHNIDLSNYTYTLPDEKIAKYPLQDRSASKLLAYHSGDIGHDTFKNIQSHLPQNSLLFFNDTKVIPARIFFQKNTGATIELFLLSPLKPYSDVAKAMLAKQAVVWKCMIGNKRKWKANDKLTAQIEQSSSPPIQIEAAYIDWEENHVQLSWGTGHTFSEILELIGQMPLPPYLNRQADENDKPRYQTVYSLKEGAVAAPTAGLHFTNEILASLQEAGFKKDFLTLHVSAGTFQPIKVNDIKEHPMHFEQVHITRSNLYNLATHNGPIIAVGTTSLRTLESLYWYGIMKMDNPNAEFHIPKLFPYQQHKHLPTIQEIASFLLEGLPQDQSELIGGTEIFIFPGYKFHVCHGLVTNFHLPGSTLLLLIAALIGDDWKKIYQEAIQNNYRFLSYGDSSILLP